MTEAPVQDASPASSAHGAEVALQLEPTITRREAEQVVRRRLGGGTAAARLVHHPFWLVDVTARRSPGLLGRLRSSRSTSAGTPAAEVNPEQTAASTIKVMVDAKGGTSFISSVPVVGDRVPTPVAVLRGAPDGGVSDTARQLVATALRKRFRLGMNFELSTAPPQPAMKPNWVVVATGKDIQATVLVDGFDSSYWVMSAAKLSV